MTLRGTFKKLEAWDPATGRIEPLTIRTSQDAKGKPVTEAELALKPVTEMFCAGRRNEKVSPNLNKITL